MIRQVQPTLRPGALRQEPTLPAVGSGAVQAGPCARGDVVDGMKIIQSAGQGNQSFSYLVELSDGSRGLLKLYAPEKVMDPVARKRLQRLQCPSLVPIRSMGCWQSHQYECLQLIQGESLAAQVPMSEERVFTTVLPAVMQAFRVLHGMQLLHNDIKPDNLILDHSSGQVFLLDYGNVTTQNFRQDIGGTPIYMPPETLLFGGKVRSTASDYCALGLTLVTLLTGKALFEGKEFNQLRMAWQRSIHLPHTLSPQAQLLCNGLISIQPDRRWNEAQVERWMKDNDIQTQPAAQPKRKTDSRPNVQRIHLHFAGEWVTDIPDLIDAIRNDWETGVFMLREHRLERFLMQFDPDYFNLCQRCTEIFDRNEGLFRLIQELMPGDEIIWQGKSFADLNEMIFYTEQEEDLENSLLIRFCRANLLGFYLEKNGANPAQLEYTRRLEELSYRNPELAFQRLKLSMEETPTFAFRGQTLRSREDLYELLSFAGPELDGIVEELCNSQKFEAWLDFQQLGSVMPRVRAEMEEYR